MLGRTLLSSGRGYTFGGNSPLGHLDFDHLNSPFDLAQGGESFDLAQDREPVERLVEPFRISCSPCGIPLRGPAKGGIPRGKDLGFRI